MAMHKQHSQDKSLRQRPRSLVYAAMDSKAHPAREKSLCRTALGEQTRIVKMCGLYFASDKFCKATRSC